MRATELIVTCSVCTRKVSRNHELEEAKDKCLGCLGRERIEVLKGKGLI